MSIKKKMTESVAAVVVTYNRKQLLLGCLDALVEQIRPVDKIIIIDNASTDGTRNTLREKGHLENPCIDYVRLAENTGSSGGFYEGVKRGYEAGYDWLWLMDDDAEPEENALEKLAQHFDNDISALSGVVKNGKGISLGHRGFFNFNKIFPILKEPVKEEFYNETVVEIDMASFVGILVNREAIRKIGYPKKQFFFCHDDVEYCIRLRQIGKILLIPASVILHKEAASKRKIQKSCLGRTSTRILYDQFWLSYYKVRNSVWLARIHAKNQISFYTGMLNGYLRHIVGIFLYDDNKLKRAHFVTLSYRDGLTGSFHNTKPKRILYGESSDI